MLSTLHTLLHLIPTTLCGVGTIIIFFLQLRTQRHREVIQVIQVIQVTQLVSYRTRI